MKRSPDALINRHSWKDTRAYLRYLTEVRQNSEGTVAFARVAMDHLLMWSTKMPLPRAAELRPTFPVHLETLDISVTYRRKLLENARLFFTWARDEWPDRYDLKRDFIDGLRTRTQQGAVAERQLYTLDQVRAITALTPRSLVEERDIAAIAFMFLSGMRGGAFVSMPLLAVDWERSPVLVRQWPDLGVRTKNGKAANTYLLAHSELADLRAIAEAWHKKAVAAVGERAMWYTLIEPDRETFSAFQVPGEHRVNGLVRRLQLLCARAGVEYLSPHKLRHGHIVWALERCNSLADFKAVSQNVMHESMQTTDAMYSGLLEADVAARIAGLGSREVVLGQDKDALLDALAQALFRAK